MLEERWAVTSLTSEWILLPQALSVTPRTMSGGKGVPKSKWSEDEEDALKTGVERWVCMLKRISRARFGEEQSGGFSTGVAIRLHHKFGIPVKVLEWNTPIPMQINKWTHDFVEDSIHGMPGNFLKCVTLVEGVFVI